MYLDEISFSDTDEKRIKENLIQRLVDEYLHTGQIERDWMWIRYIDLRSRFDEIDRSNVWINI